MTVSPELGITPSAQSAVAISMEDPGHWHFSRSKHLLFHVTDGTGAPLSGLRPSVRVRTLSGQVEELTLSGGKDGTYATKYAAWEIGSGYATSYSVVFAVEYGGRTYAEAWPFEVVRDGREDIFKADGRFSYQVRYGWVPGRPVAHPERPVTFYFEPRRSLVEGQALDRRQPWRAPSEHLPNADAQVIVASSDGAIKEELPAVYSGMGIYRAQRIFTAEEVGAERSYLVSLTLTDPYNGEEIGVADNAYQLEIRGE